MADIAVSTRWKIRRIRDVFGGYRWWILPPSALRGPVLSYPDFESARSVFATGAP